ncbi:MAG: hypothetical protein PHS04_00455 [Tissierellia bacterium]|nr:hypothetical protein [Tissierellia bacterium]
MRPYNRIEIGDMYKERFTKSLWLVMDKDDEDKMVQILLVADKLPPNLNVPIWKSYRDKIFNVKV